MRGQPGQFLFAGFNLLQVEYVLAAYRILIDMSVKERIYALFGVILCKDI